MRIRSILLSVTMLVVLLTAGAAQSLSGSNTVASDDIVDGQVYAPDIHKNAVTAEKVAAGSVTASKLGTLTRVIDSISVANGQTNYIQVNCPSGIAIAGSATWSNSGANTLMVHQGMLDGGNPTGYFARGLNTSGQAQTLTVRAWCLR